jgi:hypothetical protein
MAGQRAGPPPLWLVTTDDARKIVEEERGIERDLLQNRRNFHSSDTSDPMSSRSSTSSLQWARHFANGDGNAKGYSRRGLPTMA